MYFEHIVPIDSPACPVPAFLTRQALWQGLWQRVENPALFLPGLESCQILKRGESGLSRALYFGGACIHDWVSHEKGQWLRFDVEAGSGHAGGSLTICLEEPKPARFSLRFTYETTLDANGAESDYIEYVKSAYQQSDLETVRIIRLLLAETAALPKT